MVAATGRRRSWPRLDDARGERGVAVVGALSFDPDAPDALWEPERLDIRSGGPARRGRTPGVGTARLTGVLPEPALHRDRVARVVGLLRCGVADKVVLGRSETLSLDRPLDPHAALAGFVDTDPAGNGYLVDLGGEWLVGSSPEVLVARRGDRVSAFPLAGTRPRAAGGGGTDETDPAARELLASAKDRAEHRFVTTALADALSPWCAELDVPAVPQLVATPTTWHLGTPVRGVLRRGADGRMPTALDLAASVHPTPAVCGTPDERALDIIRAVEGRGTRGFFGGAVGWCDEQGDGEFRVTIRGAVLSADGRSATAWAGGGLTVDSDPDLELAETVTKLARARQALAAGVDA